MNSKKGSLQLSVNAIVVFVLAFAMLGVGLFLTNMIREQVGGGIMSVVDINELKSPPTADTPLTVSREVEIKKGDQLNLDVGYYNRDSDTHEFVVLGIKECKAEDGTKMGADLGALPSVISEAQEVGTSEGVGYRIILSLRSVKDEYSAGTYVCTMAAYDEDDTGIQDAYETKSFYLEVTS